MSTAFIICGSRHWGDYNALADQIDAVGIPDIVIHGGAPGADTLAAQYALELDCNVICIPAQWKEYGRNAGPIRNNEMLKVLRAIGNCGYYIAVLAFPLGASHGTRNMMRLAEEHGVKVIS